MLDYALKSNLKRVTNWKTDRPNRVGRPLYKTESVLRTLGASTLADLVDGNGDYDDGPHDDFLRVLRPAHFDAPIA
jgi:hypothetical protein